MTRLDADLQRIAPRERSDGVMHRVLRTPVSREAQEYIAQAES